MFVQHAGEISTKSRLTADTGYKNESLSCIIGPISFCVIRAGAALNQITRVGLP